MVNYNVAININAKLNQEIRFLRDAADVETYLDVLNFTPKKEFEKVFDYATQDILGVLEVLKKIKSGKESEKINDTYRYLVRQIDSFSETKSSVYALCLAEALGIKKQEGLLENIQEAIATKVGFMEKDELSFFIKGLRRKLIDPFYVVCKLRLLGKLLTDNNYSDIGMLLVQYYSEPQIPIIDDENEEETTTEKVTVDEATGDDTTDSIKELLNSLSVEQLEKVLMAKKAIESN